MDSGDGGRDRGSPQVLSPDFMPLLGEGISLVLSRWTALQMAVENEWGGRDSRSKSEDLASTILSWFAHPKDQHYIDDLEDILDENMMLSFNTEIEDGSVEEVAVQLMSMHENCLKGNFESIEELRKLSPGKNAVSQSRQVIDDDEDESSDEEVSDMMIDELKPLEMAVDERKVDEEGWSVVAPRRNKGKRSG